MEMKTYHRVLTIAGSDPSGGAGIQADLKVFAACGCYGMSAITAVVDENTLGVEGIHPIPASFVQRQIRSVLGDIGVDAVKIGMLHAIEVLHAVCEILTEFSIRNVVLDPVMVATSGDALLEAEAVEVLRSELLPMVRVVTPNLPEAEALLGERISSLEDMHRVIRRLSFGGRTSVLLKGGHLESDVLTDVFYNVESGEVFELMSNRVDTVNTHGTGCTLSSAVAAFLARGHSLNDAVRAAKTYLDGAIKCGAAYTVGHGRGPLHHFFGFWE